MEENTDIYSLKVSFKDTSSGVISEANLKQHFMVGKTHIWWPDCDTYIPIISVDSSQKVIVFNCSL